MTGESVTELLSTFSHWWSIASLDSIVITFMAECIDSNECYLRQPTKLWYLKWNTILFMNHSKTLYSTLHIGLVRYIHDSTIHKGHLCLCSKLKSSHGWQWLRLLWLKSYLFSSRLLCVRHDDCWLCFILSKFLECKLSKYLQISSSVEILGPVWSPASH